MQTKISDFGNQKLATLKIIFKIIKHEILIILHNLFHANGFFLYLRKTSENLLFFDAFMGYRKRPIA